MHLAEQLLGDHGRRVGSRRAVTVASRVGIGGGGGGFVKEVVNIGYGGVGGGGVARVERLGKGGECFP